MLRQIVGLMRLLLNAPKWKEPMQQVLIQAVERLPSLSPSSVGGTSAQSAQFWMAAGALCFLVLSDEFTDDDRWCRVDRPNRAPCSSIHP